MGQKKPGNNDVYNSSGQAASSAFIDASVFLGSGQNHGVDICDIVYGILSGRIKTSSYTNTGAVIDARGLSGTALTCTKGSPWSEGGVYVTQPSPSTILLPPGTITINSTWVLPNSTRVIGEGSADPMLNGNGTTSHQTTIQACSPVSSCFTLTGSGMIQLGDTIVQVRAALRFLLKT
jgi:hypothetical protein